jgi:hypothetical protein
MHFFQFSDTYYLGFNITYLTNYGQKKVQN